MKVAFDVGGVLSKYPAVFVPLIHALQRSVVEVHVISDMHPKQKIVDMLRANGIDVPELYVHSADYKLHGELCKSKLCEELGINLIVDDFPGYLAEGAHVRLLVMPNPHEPYYNDNWVTDGSEDDFSRRKPRPTKGDHIWT